MLVGFGCIAILVGSCSLMPKVQTRSYYILSYVPATAFPPSSQRPYKFALQVGPFEVQRIFNRQNMVYRYSPHQIQYYELQQWSVRPDQMVDDVILEHLQKVNLTNRIAADFLEQRPDYRLAGVVNALEKYDAGDTYYAHLAMTFRLVRVSDGVQVWDHSFDTRRQVFQQEMVYTVRSLSAILQEEMDVVATQLDSLFFSTQNGRAPEPAPAAGPARPVSNDAPPAGKVDENAFDIVPEKR